MRISRIVVFALAATGLFFVSSSAFARGAAEGPIIFVESQGLYYDSILAAKELPPHGPFQQLYDCDQGLCTEFGPGDQGHRGGRWWIDGNGDEVMDDEDMYFSCPLLGPGREAP